VVPCLLNLDNSGQRSHLLKLTGPCWFLLRLLDLTEPYHCTYSNAEWYLSECTMACWINCSHNYNFDVAVIDCSINCLWFRCLASKSDPFDSHLTRPQIRRPCHLLLQVHSIHPLCCPNDCLSNRWPDLMFDCRVFAAYCYSLYWPIVIANPK